jgi:hypothetical protein
MHIISNNDQENENKSDNIKQDQQGKAACNERNPNTTKQQEVQPDETTFTDNSGRSILNMYSNDSHKFKKIILNVWLQYKYLFYKFFLPIRMTK